ncbi:MAG TPA: prevent-host-death protein [Candidatus Dormibacteraeota bacterium]|nr:prevent-host-death protein [Candidatus Dormibacteraeota bacterium]
MPEIRPIKDLRNTNETSKLCHARNEPVYITKNRYGHLVVMSMETYKENSAKAELELNYDKNVYTQLIHNKFKKLSSSKLK